MKRYLLSMIFLLVLVFPVLSQAPQGINYQGVIRDNGGNLQTNASLALRFSIEDGTNTLYRELHNTSSNGFGLVNLIIGKGTPLTGTFASVPWSQGPYFLKVEIDDGSGFQNLGSTELVSVPFALYAESAASVDNMSITDLTDVANQAPSSGQVLKWDGTGWIPQNENVDDADADPANEIQSLSLSGTSLSLSKGGGSVALPTGTTYSPGNGIDIIGNVITNTGDLDFNNEIQSLSLSGNSLMLSNGGGSVTLPSAPTYSAGAGIDVSGNVISNTGDLNATNEIQNLSLSGNSLMLSNGGGSVTLPSAPTYSAGAGIDISGNVISNTGDLNETNEIQSLNLSGNNLSLSNGGGSVTLPTGTTYTAGTGISISGNAITNTGDIDASDDIIIGTAAGGDLSGTYPNPSVSAIQGQSVSTTTPSAGQVLKWNGSQWVPANDNSGSSVWNQSGTDISYSGGDIGIGTTSIDAKMEVFANSTLSDPHLLLHENGNDYARLRFQNNNGSNYWTIASYIASNHRNDRLNFWNGVGGDVMTITGDGEVGIGVGISPKVPFHVGNQRRVLFGIDTLGNGDKLMFLPDLHAFRVGTVATGAASTYWNRDSIGLYSFASGLNTRAQGYGATAMGRDTEATNSYAHATGYFTNADGLYSTAMGFNTDALATGATAMGYSTDATANYSTSIGYFSKALGLYSTAIGHNTEAQSYACVAIGRYNLGNGSSSNWTAADPIFEVGIGSSNANRANAMTIRKDGRVGIGTAFPASELQVNGRIQFQTVEYLEDGGTNEIAMRGDLRATADNLYDLGTSTNRWDDVFATNGTVQTSDLRLKENIEPIPYGLEEILKLNPVRFTWKDSPQQDPKLGLIAQDLLPILKEVVKTHNLEASEEDETVLTKKELDRLGVYYSDLIPVLIKATQEQQELIEKQKAHIDKIEARLNALEK